MTSHQLVSALNSEVAPLLQWMHEIAFSVRAETSDATATVKIIAEDKRYPATHRVLAEASASSPEEADRKAVEEFWQRFDLAQDRIDDLNDRFHRNLTIPDISFEDSVWWAIHDKASSRPEFELKAEIRQDIQDQNI